MASTDQTWNTPPLSSGNRLAVACYRRGIAELVTATGHAAELLAEAVAIDPTFFVAQVGAAVADVVAGRPYRRPLPALRPLRGERQHGEIVDAELGGDRRRAADLRREHLLEYPGDLLIVWLPALHLPAR